MVLNPNEEIKLDGGWEDEDEIILDEENVISPKQHDGKNFDFG